VQLIYIYYFVLYWYTLLLRVFYWYKCLSVYGSCPRATNSLFKNKSTVEQYVPRFLRVRIRTKHDVLCIVFYVRSILQDYGSWEYNRHLGQSPKVAPAVHPRRTVHVEILRPVPTANKKLVIRVDTMTMVDCRCW
jgi:hypothetical protein